MNLEFLEEFEDPYLHTPCGKGYFLAGVVLGMLAYHQVEKAADLGSSPLFKVLSMGRLDVYTLKKHLARVPDLTAAYDLKDSRLLSLLGKAMEFIAMCSRDMGVDGNFAFTMGFVGSKDYYYGKIFPKKNENGEV